MGEKDIAKKESMLGEIISKIKTDPNWKDFEQSFDFKTIFFLIVF